MNRQQEARNRSENISDAVLNEAIKALRKRIATVDHSHDIPYIAGYSRDGRTVYIDRHLPRSFRSWSLKRVYVAPFLVTHEVIEKALLDQLQLHYLHAHQIAVRTEREVVKTAGVSWSAYQGFIKKYEKAIAEERLENVPGDLDLTPYRDEKDFARLEELVRKAGRKRG